MRQHLLVYAAAAALIGLAACNREEAATNDANPGQSAPVNAAQDATSAAVGQTSAATLGSNTVEGYVTNAAIGDMYEIEAGKMAQQKAQNAKVKALAKTIVDDHTAAMNEMKPLVTAAGQTPPAELDQRHKGLLDNLRAANGADFDKVYIDQQVAGHQEALTLHQGFADGGGDAGLKAHAAKVIPKIQMHLDQAKALDAAT
jgi:putative membrane protein